MNLLSRSILISLTTALCITACAATPSTQTNAPVISITQDSPTLQIAQSTTPASATPQPTSTMPPSFPPLAGYLAEGALMNLGRGKIYDIAISSDHSQIAIGSVGGIYILDGNDYHEVRFIKSESPHYAINSLEFTLDNAYLIAVATFKSQFDQYVYVYNTSTYELVKQTVFPQTIDSAPGVLAVSPTEPLVATIWQAQYVNIWNYETEEWIYAYNSPGKDSFVHDIKFSPNGSLLISSDKHVTLIEPKSGKKLNNFTDIFKDYVWNLAVSNDGVMAAALERNRLVVWDLATGNEITSVESIQFTNPPMYYPDIFFSTDNKTVYTAGNEGVFIWDVKTGKQINSIAISADNQLFVPEQIALIDDNRLITATTDQTLAVTDLNTERAIYSSYYFSGFQNSFSLSNAEQEFAVIRRDADFVAIYDLLTGQIKKVITGLSKPYFVRYSPLGNYLSVFDSKGGHIYEAKTYKNFCESVGSIYSQDEAFFSFQFEGKLFINSLPTCNTIHTFDLPAGKAHMFLMEDFKYLIEANLDGTINLFNVKNEKLDKSLTGFPSDYPLVKASSDSKYIAQYDATKTWIWEIETGKKIKELSTGSPVFVGHLIYTPSRLLINIWDLDTNKALSPVRLPLDKEAAISPNGKLVVLSGYDYKKGISIYVIDTATSQILYRYHGHTQGDFPIFDIKFVFSADSKKLISVGDDGSTLLWDASH
ncbi:MAG: hypothetical protein IT311_03290 [Anaerolineales bacterium]|nr:hypothetical protein [Anaerolineales bacterium]MCZ2120886.1 hypothetical protein [Anaerolineales bacterium]